ncbi:uncharacterized protein LOC106648101 [Trichogramma pretiosum]|uniref:uncharacterized protein LOC106648101 n=1 Tax=Trichogramma pretiosum TaxID=7493 RepID=UPI000C71A6AA|nr:uncharacterized protein LOC106648101 [Trichogramma pretiosum]
MPGIHVHTLGKLHWEDKDNEAALTVPGSYWFCRKNSIYKFTFKFHKSVRNNVQFSHSKELMKIVRRVLKKPPKQGQHFSTKNLIVIYNHATWTRQDRIFAVMKFRDRPDASAFSYVIILTVKIVNQLRSSGPILNEASNQRLNECTSKVGSVLRNSTFEKEKDKTEIPVTSMLTNGHSNLLYKNLNRPQASQKTYTCLKAFTSSDAIELGATSSWIISGRDDDKNDKMKRLNSGIMDCSKHNEDLESLPTTSKHDSELDFVADEENSNSSSSDSADLPYQYLIERDIEREIANSKAKSKRQVSESSVVSESLVVTEVDTKSPKCSSSRRSSASCSSVSRQDFKEELSPDLANLRSSDITDLVMKGLMFTIRQDENAVIVVEEKTKLELDEVLENSEKVETEEGDPCLLNSSLLRLEKMITRMKAPAVTSPKENEMHQNGLVSYLDSTSSNNDMATKKLDKTKNGLDWPPFFLNEENSDSELKKNRLIIGSAHNFFYNNELTQDEDFILSLSDEENEVEDSLKVSVHPSYLNDILDAKTPASSNLPDLISQKTNLDDGVPMKKKKGSNIQVEYDGSLKIPKIISNQIISDDQLPEMLLKTLKTKNSPENQENNELIKSFSNKIIAERGKEPQNEKDFNKISNNHNQNSYFSEVDSFYAIRRTRSNARMLGISSSSSSSLLSSHLNLTHRLTSKSKMQKNFTQKEVDKIKNFSNINENLKIKQKSGDSDQNMVKIIKPSEFKRNSIINVPKLIWDLNFTPKVVIERLDPSKLMKKQI